MNEKEHIYDDLNTEWKLTEAQQRFFDEKKGARITPMDALRRFGCFRLSARIADLRVDGNKIFSHMVERNGKHVAEYYMGATRKLT